MKDKADFKHISELKWDPYIGKDYFKNKTKILIIGESHYKKGVDIEKYENRNFTNHVVNIHAIKGKYSKLFPNFHKALFGKLDFDNQQLWDNLAFYNFVQRSMDSNKKRPSKDDFYNGWLTFFKIVEVLKPTHCIFLGVSAISTFRKAEQHKENIEIQKFERGPKIQNTFPREFTLRINNNLKITGILIKHTSQYFSWSKWNTYLQKEMEEELKWLKKIVVE